MHMTVTWKMVMPLFRDRMGARSLAVVEPASGIDARQTMARLCKYQRGKDLQRLDYLHALGCATVGLLVGKDNRLGK